MAHAMLVIAEIVPGRRSDALASLRDHTIPWVTQMPGFTRGTWFGDDHVGYGLVIFAAEEHARVAADMVSAGADDPVRIQSVQVYQVNAEA